MQHRSLTIMFTDMKGFTPRTSTQSRAATLDMIRQHKELMLPVIECYGGTLVKGIGDAFLVTFESPTDAVLAGVALQETMRQYNAEAPEAHQVEIRVAINTGEVSTEEGDVYGEAVNIAARIEGIAEPNEVYFTEATYLSMNKTEVPSAEIGFRILRGIPEKIKVYKVLREGERAPRRKRRVAAVPARAGVAPVWRRAIALGLDCLLVGLVAALLTAKQGTVARRAKNALDTRRKAIDARLDEMMDKVVQEALWGDQPPHADLPFQNEIARFRRRRGNEAAVGGAVGAELKERAELLEEKLRIAGDQFVNELLWGNGEVPSDFPHAQGIADFRELRQRVEKLENESKKAQQGVSSVLLLIYAIVAVGWRSRTPGKAALRLRVTCMQGGAPGWKRAIIRGVLYPLSASVFGLGFIWALFDANRQTWHDKIAGTCVVLEGDE